MSKRVLVGLLVMAACGGDAPVVKTPPVATAKPTPPPPIGARWYFPTPASGVNDRLDLDDGSMLLVGDVGRREIVKDGTATDSPILIPDKVVGSWRDAKKDFIFIADNGDAYVSHDALGPFEVRKGPTTEKITAEIMATGKGSAMVSTSDGKLLRTGDSGVSWKPVDYKGGAKVFGHAAHFDLDHAGNGILVHVPQRLFVTHDDGATWKPIASPALGVGGAEDDAKSKSFFVKGYRHQYYKLAGDTLTATDDNPEELGTLAVQHDDDKTNEDDSETTRILAGSHVLEFQRFTEGKKDKQVSFRSTKIGTPPAAFKPMADLSSRQSLENLVAAWGSTIVVVRSKDDTDENTPSSTVMTSLDGGATWKASATLEGDDAVSNESVAVGPKGWTFVPALCGTFGEKHERNCNPAKVRVANGTEFDDLVFTDEFRPRRFAFDEAHDKVYAIGMTDGGSPTVYESKLTQNKFTTLSKPIKTAYHEHTRMTVLPDGTLHVFHMDEDKSVIAIERRDVGGKELPTLYVPAKVEAGSTLKGLSLIGARGIAMNGKAAGWETADGGATWMRVATNGAENPECSDGGCVAGEAQRVGWDLPVANTVGEVVTVTATPTAPADNPTPDDPSDDVLPALNVNVSCKASGAITKLPSLPQFENTNPARDVLWYLHETDKDGKKTLTVGGRTSIRHETLMDVAPKPPKDVERSVAERSLADGLVVARYTHAPQKPVDVELAAFSLETGQVQRATLAKLPPFRVARYGFSGDVQLVSGGLLFQATDASPASFIHTDGKTEQISLPAHASLSHAQHVGKSWMLLSTDNYLADANYSDDSGAHWQEHAWLVTDSSSAPVTFVRGVGGKPWISTAVTEGPVLFSLSSPPPAEIPMPQQVDPAAMSQCDFHAPYGTSFRRPTHNGGHATFDFADKKGVTADISQRIVQVTPAGNLCTMGYSLYGSRLRVVLYRDGKNTFGWAFRTADDYRSQSATPLTCTGS